MRRRQRYTFRPIAVLASCCCLSIALVANASKAMAQVRPPARQPERKPVNVPSGVQHTATIDLQRVLAECQSFQESLKELHVKDAERRKPIKELQQNVSSLEGLVAQFVVGSPKHAECSRKLFKAQGELSTAQQEADYELDRAEGNLYVGFYHLVERTIHDHARQHNIGIVLNRSPAPEFVPQRKHAEALFERVVAFDHHVDITDDILLQLSRGKVKPRVPDTMSE